MLGLSFFFSVNADIVRAVLSLALIFPTSGDGVEEPLCFVYPALRPKPGTDERDPAPFPFLTVPSAVSLHLSPSLPPSLNPSTPPSIPRPPPHPLLC